MTPNPPPTRALTGLRLSMTLGNPKSINLTQAWNFEGLASSGAEDSTAADIASDDAQLDSSADERGLSQFDDPDTVMTGHDPADELLGPSAPYDGAKATLADIQNATREGVIAVRPAEESDGESNEVAEIHLESEKGTRTE
ncbi:hypothetical protein NM208_g13470 [Fusarium decemcellulare]|uniref:Uncharacterized protein n=1 Tax=Fusarium decemcellulare TaxID=57161 RepID=A0ACC1RJS5_9HYPO|nr:hypothetical protein NM208_g13470 [Fusarium decemcellulare]